MTTTINNEHKKLNVPNKQEQNQTCLDSAEREGLSPKGNVPNLRFPEFQGEWEKCKLGNIANVTGGYAFKSDTLNSIGGKYQVVKMGNLYQNQLDLHRSPSYTNILTSKAENVILRKGDIAITLTGTNNKRDFGYTYIFNDEKNLLLNQRCGLIRTKGDPYFLSCLLKTYAFLNQFFESATGGTGNQANVSTKAMEMFSVNTPSLKEQKKIGVLMALLDERIATQNKIIDKLQSLIKGISNRLLYETEGKPVCIGDILLERSERTRTNNQHEVLSSTVKGIFSQREYFSKDIASENNVGYKIIRLHDIVLSPQNLWMGNINYNDKFDIGIVSPSYKIFSIAECYDKRFIAALLKTHRALYNYMLVSEQGASIVRRNLNMEAFSQLVFKIPSLEKQREIGYAISLLKFRLETANNIIRAYTSQKQHLLRQMFI